MPRRAESSVISDIKKILNSLPCCMVRKRKPYISGDPDLTGSYHGIRIEIEVKTDGGVVTKLQKKRVRDWQELECIAGIAWSAEDAIDIMWNHLVTEDKKTLAKYMIKKYKNKR